MKKIYLFTEQCSVKKENTIDATVDAVRKKMAECNNLLQGRRDFIDKILAEQEDNKESLAAIQSRPPFTILEDEIVFIEGDQSFPDVKYVQYIEKGKSLALSIASARVR